MNTVFVFAYHRAEREGVAGWSERSLFSRNLLSSIVGGPVRRPAGRGPRTGTGTGTTGTGTTGTGPVPVLQVGSYSCSSTVRYCVLVQ